MNNTRRFTAFGTAAAAAAALALPTAASAADGQLLRVGCDPGTIKIWGANGAVWATADLAGCGSSVASGRKLALTIYKDGRAVASDTQAFYRPIIVIGVTKYEAHPKTAVTYNGSSQYRACAKVEGELLNAGCVNK